MSASTHGRPPEAGSRSDGLAEALIKVAFWPLVRLGAGGSPLVVASSTLDAFGRFGQSDDRCRSLEPVTAAEGKQVFGDRVRTAVALKEGGN